MARSKTNRRQKRALDQLLETGVVALIAGVVLLFLPLLNGALRPLSGLALILGGILVCVHFVMKARQENAKPERFTSSLTRKRPRPAQDDLSETSDPAARRSADTANDPTSSYDSAEPPNPNPASLTVTRPEPATSWSPAVFAAIEWRRFEAVCEALFAQAGFRTKSQSHGADGGVDIWLHSANAQGPVAVVQCKHWQGKAVGVKEIREFFGVMASHQLKRGTYATTSSYTADARQFAKDNGINAMDGPALLALIGKRSPEHQQALLNVAYEGDYWRPTCASCGIKLVERQPAKGGAGFWGCSNYPRCKSRLPMVAALR